MNKDEAIELIRKRLKEHTMIVERMPCVLSSIFVPGIVMMEELHHMRFSWDTIFFALKDNFVTLHYPENAMITPAKRIVERELEQQEYYAGLIEGWRGAEDEFIALTKTLLSQKKGILPLYDEFMALFRKVWAVPLTANNLSYYAESIFLPQIIKEYGAQGQDEFLTLSTPRALSMIQSEEKELLELAVQKEELSEEELNDRLEQHSSTFYWLNTNYRDFVYLNRNHFREKLDVIENPAAKLKLFLREREEFEKKQDALLEKNSFTESELIVAKLLRQATELQDLRKKYNLIGNYVLSLFLREAAGKYDYSFEELCYTTQKEFEAIIAGENVSKSMLQQRLSCCVCLLEVGLAEVFGGPDAEEMHRIVEEYDTPKKGVKEVKGLTASLGKAKGKVRVVMDPTSVGQFDEGDILIASMTRPDFTFLMKKAGAIVTDEGGITCHASIVSRELGIPCVIGTKVATRVFKDGDVVEVDADKGVVRKIR